MLLFLLPFILESVEGDNKKRWAFIEKDFKEVIKNCQKVKMKELFQRIDLYQTKLYDFIPQSKDKDFLNLYQTNKKVRPYLSLYGYAYLHDSLITGHIAKSCGIYFNHFRDALKLMDEESASKGLIDWRSCLKSQFRALPKEASDMIGCYKKIP